MGVQKAFWHWDFGGNCAFSCHLQLVITHMALVFHVIGYHGSSRVPWIFEWKWRSSLRHQLLQPSVSLWLRAMFMLRVSNVIKKSKKWVITSEESVVIITHRVVLVLWRLW